MKLDWLIAFKAVMQTGTITGASTIVLRTQPQVTRMIASLEEELGFRLFLRKGRRLVPTAESLDFLKLIDPMLSDFRGIKSAVEAIRQKRGRRITIVAEPFMLHALVPHAVGRLFRQDAQSFTLKSCSRETGLWSTDGQFDIAVVAVPFAQTDLSPIIFAEAQVVAVLPPRHNLRRQQKLRFADISDQTFIGLHASTLLRAQIDLEAARQGIDLKVSLEAASGVACCEMVAEGLGVTLADPIVASSFRARGVSIHELDAALLLHYGFLLHERHGGSEAMTGLMTALASDAARLGGRFVRLTGRAAEGAKSARRS